MTSDLPIRAHADTWSCAVPATYVIRKPYDSVMTYVELGRNKAPSSAVRKKARAERKRLKKDKQRHKKG